MLTTFRITEPEAQMYGQRGYGEERSVNSQYKWTEAERKSLDITIKMNSRWDRSRYLNGHFV